MALVERLRSRGAMATARLGKGESVGRPVGAPSFLAELEPLSGRRLAPLKREPKPRRAERH
jgi:hypothetical protein